MERKSRNNDTDDDDVDVCVSTRGNDLRALAQNTGSCDTLNKVETKNGDVAY
jgi:hypothetical protein